MPSTCSDLRVCIQNNYWSGAIVGELYFAGPEPMGVNGQNLSSRKAHHRALLLVSFQSLNPKTGKKKIPIPSLPWATSATAMRSAARALRRQRLRTSTCSMRSSTACPRSPPRCPAPASSASSGEAFPADLDEGGYFKRKDPSRVLLDWDLLRRWDVTLLFYRSTGSYFCTCILVDAFS